MTALLAPATGDETLDYGWAVLYRADELPWPAGYDVIAGAAQELRDSLELSEAMTGLGWDQSPTMTGTVEQVTRDIPGQAEALIAAVRKHIGDDAARYAETGERS